MYNGPKEFEKHGHLDIIQTEFLSIFHWMIGAGG